MPVFDSAKGDVNWFALPNTAATILGGSGSSMQEEGTLYRVVSPGINPGGTGALDYVLATVTLPPGTFDGASITDLFGGALTVSPSNRGIAISAQGSSGPTNATAKRLKLWVGATSAVLGSQISGGTLIADTGNFNTVSIGWSIGAELYKYGAAGTNTQIAVHQQAQMGSALGALLAPQSLSLNESSSIIVALTGSVTTAVTDIAANLFVVTGFN